MLTRDGKENTPISAVSILVGILPLLSGDAFYSSLCNLSPGLLSRWPRELDGCFIIVLIDLFPSGAAIYRNEATGINRFTVQCLDSACCKEPLVLLLHRRTVNPASFTSFVFNIGLVRLFFLKSDCVELILSWSFMSPSLRNSSLQSDQRVTAGRRICPASRLIWTR